MDRARFTAALLIVGVAVALLLGVVPPSEDVQPPDPEITSLEITDRGCDADVRDFAGSGGGGNATRYSAGTMTVDTTTVELSGEIRLTSADDARVRTYRVDLRTHSAASNDTAGVASCQPEIAYRVEYDGGSGPVGTRYAVFVDGNATSCGGSTSGPDIGCQRLMTPEIPTYWSNASDGRA